MDRAPRHRSHRDPSYEKEGAVYSVAFSPDGKTLAAGYGLIGLRGSVVLWDVATRKRLAEDPLRVEEGNVQSVAFSPDGKTLAAGHGGGVGGVVLWDVALIILAAPRRLNRQPQLHLGRMATVFP